MPYFTHYAEIIQEGGRFSKKTNSALPCTEAAALQ